MVRTYSKKICGGLVGLSSVLWLGGCASQATAPPPAPEKMTHEEMKEKILKETIRNTNPVDRANVLTDLMTTKLSLNEVQRMQVSKLNLDYSTRFNMLVTSKNPAISKREEFIRLSAEKEAKLLSILNETQKTYYHAHQSEFLDTYRMM